MAHSSWATVCQNSNGTPTDVFYDLSNVFNSSNNRPGQVVTLPEKSGWIGVNATCPAGTTVNYTYRSYVTELPVQSTENGFQYLKLNDYLLGAMSITDSSAGLFYPPRNYIRMGTHPNVPKQQPFGVMDSKLVFKLKVIRSFINMVPIPRQTMFRVYVTTSTGDALSTPVYTISYSGKVEVPQNCEVNAGQIVEFDFGDIGASLFSKAGAGNRPEGINPQTKTVAIKCTNVAAQAYLTMRVEAEKASGQMMVSDNPDLGFIVADKTGRPLTPNNLSSTIPFQLDDNAVANVSIRTWPVSVTGNKPTEGPFTARGYLRVDYD
ncbi:MULTISPECIES: type 1 fimbria D-mannose specific adhesin FimH [Citrobacter]|uniref:Type 1 fimbria D-mannose specific adhesin FimH n=2 Tax=Citrobacter portucalensis TaxID=1639133 RepID=A0AAJ1JMF2_9ENTR|nr:MULTISPECIES: type 1 fimbria D-mannose specific adhesin FimH [Citrobacter]MCE9796233.1 type 1 fimbria D-mannose specific adhesin FimH [Citrobacter portucalensis]MCR3693821.1 type 1 fimbria D-mannose specific adhesin FimH [Citrobacter portucalensis]MCR3702555.1 type 1 fimbria D-mannose specific adhesin FimH [Citrobacter portucalensis]MCX8975962.1 type 1 fimbria D-mannose specific adhesin FimH [Citrobacter portucalensis]MCX9034119.1 type 1 fimbria D-mannose specific adhesin FimH [Citrobacter 